MLELKLTVELVPNSYVNSWNCTILWVNFRF